MRKYFLFSILWIGLWCYIIYKVTSSALPYNPLSPDMNVQAGITTFIPEGWGFFTRDPREPDLYLFVLKNKQWVKSANMPISNFRNAMGLNRLPRAMSVELAMLMSEIKEDDWVFSDLNVNKPDMKDFSIIPLKNTSPHPTLKDTLCIVQQEPVPWAWSWNRDRLSLPSKYIVINVRKK